MRGNRPAAFSGSEISARDDYALAFSAIAIWSEDQERLEAAKSLLKAYEPAEPYFRERRLALLLNVSEGISKSRISEKQKQESAPKGGFVSLLSKFVLIQPNLAGFGLNLNAIFEELGRRKPQGQSPTDEAD